jgi:hypothetical protein
MGIDPNSSSLPAGQLGTFTYVGLCLSCVQQAERALQATIQTVLDDENVKLAEQSEPERKQTLGDFLKKLKRRAKLPITVKDRLYAFLRMRNRLVHEFDFDLSTEEGNTAARLFLLELTLAAISISGLMVAIFQVWAKDHHGEDFYTEDFFKTEAKQHLQLVKLFEDKFGGIAREILAGRNKALAKRQVKSAKNDDGYCCGE